MKRALLVALALLLTACSQSAKSKAAFTAIDTAAHDLQITSWGSVLLDKRTGASAVPGPHPTRTVIVTGAAGAFEEAVKRAMTLGWTPEGACPPSNCLLGATRSGRQVELFLAMLIPGQHLLGTSGPVAPAAGSTLQVQLSTA